MLCKLGFQGMEIFLATLMKTHVARCRFQYMTWQVFRFVSAFIIALRAALVVHVIQHCHRLGSRVFAWFWV
jgi:hypothetical protein